MYYINYINISEGDIYSACNKYLKKYGNKNIKKHFGITINEFNNIYQAGDTTEKPKNLTHWYKELHSHSLFNLKNSKNLTKKKIKKATFLLLAYHKKLIIFK